MLLLDVVDGVMVSANVLIWISLKDLLSGFASMLSILFGLNYYETEQNKASEHRDVRCCFSIPARSQEKSLSLKFFQVHD